MKLSAVILTKNEEKNIGRAIKSVDFCDEILVVDDYSQDKTIENARKLGARIVSNHLNDDFSMQRNFAIERAKGEWVLFIDADEVVSPELKHEIKRLLYLPVSDTAYYIKRRDWFWGREVTHGEVATAAQHGIIRLVKKGSGSFVARVHEEYKTTGSTGVLKNYLNHYPHQTLTEFINGVNKYSTMRAQELHQQKVKDTIFITVAYPFGKFFYTYFVKRGFLDGAAGFVYSFMMSFHSFLVRAKLYQYRNLK